VFFFFFFEIEKFFNQKYNKQGQKAGR